MHILFSKRVTEAILFYVDLNFVLIIHIEKMS